MYENLTERYANGHDPQITGRDSQLEILMLTLLRHEKPNALLVGPPGVGKTSLIHLLAYQIANRLCPVPLHGFHVIEIYTNALLAGPGYRGVTEEKFQTIIDQALTKGKVILFFDEFHTVEKLGQMANGQTPGLGNTLKPYLTRPDFRVVGATTDEEFKAITDKALLRRLFKIDVGEPDDDAVIRIIQICLGKYGAGLTFKREIISQILQLSKTMEGYNPDKAKDIVDLLCAFCTLKEIKKVTKDIVEDFFSTFFMQRISGAAAAKTFANVIIED